MAKHCRLRIFSERGIRTVTWELVKILQLLVTRAGTVQNNNTKTVSLNIFSVFVTLTRRFSTQSGLRGSFHSESYLKDKGFSHLSFPTLPETKLFLTPEGYKAQRSNTRHHAQSTYLFNSHRICQDCEWSSPGTDYFKNSTRQRQNKVEFLYTLCMLRLKLQY